MVPRSISERTGELGAVPLQDRLLVDPLQQLGLCEKRMQQGRAGLRILHLKGGWVCASVQTRSDTVTNTANKYHPGHKQ